MKNVSSIDITQDLEVPVDRRTLQTVNYWVQEFRQLDAHIVDVENELSQLKANRDKITQEYLPDLLATSGVSSVTLDSGEVVYLDD